MQKNLCVVALIILFSTACSSTENIGICSKDFLDTQLGTHIVAETCRNVGVFSIGGLYDGQWEKLTYFYPKPWSGTYLTVNVDGKYYATSDHPKNAIQMDQYLTSPPTVQGEGLTTRWILPDNIHVTQKLKAVENGTKIEVTIENKDSQTHKTAVRLHLDTMVGVNDGAPIYIPGDGLKISEAEYHGATLNFKYWKAYNRQDDPTIVATGYINPEEGLSYPTKVLIADWKRSKDYPWDYAITPGLSILGDSALLLYYNTIEVTPHSNYSITTNFGSGKPVLPKEKGEFGITEITSDNVYGIYCPTNKVNISVDVISSKEKNEGIVTLKILENGKLIYNESNPTGLVDEDSYRKIKFTWQIPESQKDKSYNTEVTLTDKDGGEIDEIEKPGFIKIDASKCKLREKRDLGPYVVLFFAMLFFGTAVLVVMAIFRKRGKVSITKVVDEKGRVKVTVLNDTKEDLNKCVVEDGIPSQAELTVSTMAVIRRDNKLVWEIEKLASGKTAVLEYKIRGANVLPPAKITWDGGEEISA
ncbi:MAG: hypothetical protein ABH851_01700 [Methanobacteriota archaeon]